MGNATRFPGKQGGSQRRGGTAGSWGRAWRASRACGRLRPLSALGGPAGAGGSIGGGSCGPPDKRDVRNLFDPDRFLARFLPPATSTIATPRQRPEWAPIDWAFPVHVACPDAPAHGTLGPYAARSPAPDVPPLHSAMISHQQSRPFPLVAHRPAYRGGDANVGAVAQARKALRLHGLTLRQPPPYLAHGPCRWWPIGVRETGGCRGKRRRSRPKGTKGRDLLRPAQGMPRAPRAAA